MGESLVRTKFPAILAEHLTPPSADDLTTPRSLRATYDWTVYRPEGLKIAEPAWDEFAAMTARMLPARWRENPTVSRGLYVSPFNGAFQKAWMRRGYAMYGVVNGRTVSDDAPELATYGCEGKRDNIFDLRAVPESSFDFAILDRVICTKHFYQHFDPSSGTKDTGSGPLFAAIFERLKPDGAMIGILYQWYSVAVIQELASHGRLTLWPFEGEGIVGFTLSRDPRPTALPDPLIEPIETSPYFGKQKSTPDGPAALFIPTNELVTATPSGRLVEFAPPLLAPRETPTAPKIAPKSSITGGLAADGDPPLCEVCGGAMNDADPTICPTCLSRTRTRSVAHVLEELVIPLFGKDIDRTKEVLCFSMDRNERVLLSRHFHRLKSVSLYGKYHPIHDTGVDARDLSRYADGEFAMVYSCLLFDYFVEHEAALKEAARVLAPGGVFLTCIEPPRILEGDAAPIAAQTITPRPGYYDYIPADKGMVSVKVGRQWLLATMRRVGFEARSQKFTDASSGVDSEWFVGRKPLAG